MRKRIERIVLALLLLLPVCMVVRSLSDNMIWLRAPCVVETLELDNMGKGGDCCYSIIWNRDEWQAFAEQADVKDELGSRLGRVRDAIIVVARGMELVTIHTPESEKGRLAFKGGTSLPSILEFRRRGGHHVMAYVVENGSSRLYFASTTPGIAKSVKEDVAVPFNHWRTR